MKAEIVPSVRTRRDGPRWIWRVWDGGRALAAGIEDSEEDARAAAERALRRLDMQQRMHWGSPDSPFTMGGPIDPQPTDADRELSRWP